MRLLFIKLGGSVITDKTTPLRARPQVLRRLGLEIAEALRRGGARLLLGNGGGSFAHYFARPLLSPKPPEGPELHRAAMRVHSAAAQLNGLVVEALLGAGVPAVGFSPLSSALAHAGRILLWELQPMRRALEQGLVPVIHGDVLLDLERGYSIFSTERLFHHLALQLRPERVIVGTDVDGVYAQDPKRSRHAQRLERVTQDLLKAVPELPTRAIDVTGGMREKLNTLLQLSRDLGIECEVINARRPGLLRRAILGERGLGTVVAWA
ncbi:MAG: hypothetical protein C4339_02975 [Nitrososphaerota archaeon]